MRPSLRPLLALPLALALPACSPRPPITPDVIRPFQVCATDQATVYEALGFPDRASQLSSLTVWSYWKHHGAINSGQPPVLLMAFDPSNRLVDLVYNPPAAVTIANRCRE